jgi:hypothetical protein
MAVALMVGWYALLGRFRALSLADLSVGALALLCLGMLGTAIAFPALSYAFTWPSLFSMLALAYWFWGASADQAALSRSQAGVLLLAAAPSVLLFIPSLMVGFFGLDRDELYIALLFVVVMLGYLLPQVHPYRSSGGKPPVQG